MKVIDERALPICTTFGDLAIGDAFQDDDADICIKTGISSYMYYDTHGRCWVDKYNYADDEPIIPLEITYKVERKKE